MVVTFLSPIEGHDLYDDEDVLTDLVTYIMMPIVFIKC